mgnify:CR=1 FL=1
MKTVRSVSRDVESRASDESVLAEPGSTGSGTAVRSRLASGRSARAVSRGAGVPVRLEGAVGPAGWEENEGSGTPGLEEERAVDLRDRAVALNDGFQRVPVLEFDDGSVLVEPTNDQLAAKLKI